MNEKDITVFTGETLPERKEIPQSAIQMRSERCVAMIVPKPRSLERIEQDVLKEAKYAKHDFYYNWSVNDRKNNRKQWIEGGTIGLAQSMYRCWNNCELVTTVRTEAGYWIISSTFYDFENGSTLNREHRVRIPNIDQKDSDYDRKLDMKFQAWYSKNQRNTIFAALPRWLKNKAIEAAKSASQNELKDDKKEKLLKAINYFKSRGISEKDILLYFEKDSVNDFDLDDVLKVCNIANQLYNGDIKPEDISNQISEDFEAEKKQFVKSGKDLREKGYESHRDKSEESSQSNKKSETKQRDTKKDQPKSGPQSHKKNQKESPFDLILKSFEVRGISDTEICAYFNIEDLSELDFDQGLAELEKVITEIESENMTVEEFKRIGVERFEMRIKEKK